jgi:hypothetical protein
MKDGKGVHKVPEDYQGPRTAAAIVNAALAKLPSFVSDINSKSLDSFLNKLFCCFNLIVNIHLEIQNYRAYYFLQINQKQQIYIKHYQLIFITN